MSFFLFRRTQQSLSSLLRSYKMGIKQEYSVKESISPVKVLVVGGSYGGLAAALNLLDLCKGKQGRCSRDVEAADGLRVNVPIQIKFVDERDGYCKSAILERAELVLTRFRPLDRIPSCTRLGRICCEVMGQIRKLASFKGT